MWITKRDYLDSDRTLRLRFFSGDACLSYAEFLRALADEPGFRDLLIQELRSAPFVAFRWETPPVTTDTIDQPFACLLHDSRELDVSANPTDFGAHFRPDSELVCFENLGRDALLVVPCPVSDSANYSHVASFHRTAPQSQQHAFWSAVAKTVQGRVGSRPLWLSTAGGGVDWLHMRLDDQPKYYRHLPWRHAQEI